MNHIGLDVHCSRIDVSLVREGREVFRTVVEADEKRLQEVLQSIGGRKRVVLEEGLMADWCKRAVEPWVEKAIVCDPKWNRLISEAEDKDDPVDAFRLALLDWMGQIRAVYHADAEGQQLKEAAIGYWQASEDLTRAKNRLKSQFLRRGIWTGDELYRERGYQQWRDKLEGVWAPELADSYFEQLCFCRDQKAKRIVWLRQKTKPYQAGIRRLESIPGWGYIVAVTFWACIQDPWRFANKRKLWKYCGLAIRERKSAGKLRGRRRRSRDYNRRLRGALGIAAQAALRTRDNDLIAYAESVAAQGKTGATVRRNLARKMAVIAIALWRKKECYRNGPSQ